MGIFRGKPTIEEVGYNTPDIIKYQFWQMTAENRSAVYVCVNTGQTLCPSEIVKQAVCLDGDIEADWRKW